jgi:hypothetical protein
MATWKAKLPDYEFILWDTARFDMNSVLWVKQAFDVKLYACAADYIRLYAVYSHGGIYLDMDMEVVKPFDELLKADTMLAYENNVNHNIEAGCFGAEPNHPYIKKCMEYFEENPLFDPILLPNILNLPQSKRHEFIAPFILPEIMKSAAEKYFSDGSPRFFSPDYFTAKNVLTGKIEATKNTFTIHHFAAQYHSDEWRKNRGVEQSIYVSFGEKAKISKIIIVTRHVIQRIKRCGFFNAMRYYVDSFILRKREREGLKL